MSSLVESIGGYLELLVNRSLKVRENTPVETDWMHSWTLFYWGWWISWSPFVGMFIARISRGRTIREFVLGVLLVPLGVTFLWFSVFGGTALWDGSDDRRHRRSRSSRSEHGDLRRTGTLARGSGHERTGGHRRRDFLRHFERLSVLRGGHSHFWRAPQPTQNGSASSGQAPREPLRAWQVRLL